MSYAISIPPAGIFAALLLFTRSLYGQSASSPGDSVDYEELPELKASEILQETILNGPHHKVREEVPTYSGANHFTIDSDFGVFYSGRKRNARQTRG